MRSHEDEAFRITVSKAPPAVRGAQRLSAPGSAVFEAAPRRSLKECYRSRNHGESRRLGGACRAILGVRAASPLARSNHRHRSHHGDAVCGAHRDHGEPTRDEAQPPGSGAGQHTVGIGAQPTYCRSAAWAAPPEDTSSHGAHVPDRGSGERDRGRSSAEADRRHRRCDDRSKPCPDEEEAQNVQGDRSSTPPGEASMCEPACIAHRERHHHRRYHQEPPRERRRPLGPTARGAFVMRMPARGIRRADRLGEEDRPRADCDREQPPVRVLPAVDRRPTERGGRPRRSNHVSRDRS